MKNRGRMAFRTSKREFKRGDKTRIINVKKAPARGGIRL